MLTLADYQKQLRPDGVRFAGISSITKACDNFIGKLLAVCRLEINYLLVADLFSVCVSNRRY